MVGIAVAGFAPGADARANLATASGLVEEAAGRGARLVVLPEYASCFAATLGRAAVEAAQPLDGPFTAGMIALAARTGTTVVFGLVEAGDGRRFRNTALAVDGTGVLAAYRKTHLYDAFGETESRWVEPGDLVPPRTFEVGGLRVGLQTCYDLRFPEVTRLLADAGADVVAVPSQWVPGPGKVHHWRTLLTARAIEDTAYVLGAGQVPPAGIGTSLIVDPFGEVLAELGEEPGVAVAEADPERVVEVRRANPALALRRYRVVPR